jgi:DNA-binding HxlR family transcriptional regulator
VPEDCRAVSEVLARVGDKWTVLVVSLLGDGSKRFNELRRGLGSISQRMLTLTLKDLERESILTSVRKSPAKETEYTACAKKSLNHKRPSRQRGPSP